jgi:hypothetical protein
MKLDDSIREDTTDAHTTDTDTNSTSRRRFLGGAAAVVTGVVAVGAWGKQSMSSPNSSDGHIVKSTPSHLSDHAAAMRDTIKRNGYEVVSIMEQNNSVRIRYRMGTTVEEQAKQLAAVASAYLFEVEDGWPFRPLYATVVNKQGQSVGSWHITAYTVKQYTYNNIDNSELTTQLLSSTELPYGNVATLTPVRTPQPTSDAPYDVHEYVYGDDDDYVGGGVYVGSSGDDDGGWCGPNDVDADNDGICDEE